MPKLLEELAGIAFKSASPYIISDAAAESIARAVALRCFEEAAKVADKLIHGDEAKDTWSITRSGAFVEFRERLRSLAKELEE